MVTQTVTNTPAAPDAALPSAASLYFTEHGTGAPLLLVHGLMVSGALFAPVVARFAARHRVIVPDLRGHGRSRGLGPPYTVAQLAADLAGLLDRLGVGAAAVLGYSQGGAIAQQLALDHPARCTRLVLACTYAHNMATAREQLEGRLAPLLLRVLGMRRFARFVAAQASAALGPEGAGWLAGLIAEQDRDLMIAAWHASMAFDSRRRLAAIRCPTLVVAGSNDHAVPMHHARMLHAGIAGSQLAVIQGGDHALIWSHPDEFVRVTEAFLGA